MRILLIGDIFGRPGRQAVEKLLPSLKQEEDINFVVANCENASHGRGPSPEAISDLKSYGVDFFTSGNHIWDNRDTVSKLSDAKFPVLRPANYPEGNPGRGFAVVQTKLLKNVLVINLQGRVFMPEGLDNPFRKVDEILEKYEHDSQLSAIIVDLHAEATSEKNAMRHYLDGRVSALVGTHTHVQTSDAFVTAGGMGYITDLGMTGVYQDSVIGLQKDSSLDLFLRGNIFQWEVAEGRKVLQGVIVEVDEKTKKAISIQTVQKEAA